MNIIELQENFEIACFYYADQIEKVESFEKLLVADYSKNPDVKTGEPNYYKVITQWNHSSKQPTDDELMVYTVQEVQNYYNSNKNEAEGATPMRLFIDGIWKDVLLRSS